MFHDRYSNYSYPNSSALPDAFCRFCLLRRLLNKHCAAVVMLEQDTQPLLAQKLDNRAISLLISRGIS